MSEAVVEATTEDPHEPPLLVERDGFVTVLTAAITSGFVARSSEERSRVQDAPPSAEVLQEIVVSLRRLEERLGDRAH